MKTLFLIILTLAFSQSVFSQHSKNKNSSSATLKVVSSTITEAIIGTTSYDFQSFRSVGKRISNNGNGTLSAVWSIDNFPNHGIGYRYYDGTAWNLSANISSVGKSAFPNICVTPAGEFVVANEDTFGLLLAKCATVGSGIWNKDSVGTGVGDDGVRFATGGITGDTLHVLAKTGSMLTYSRSTDGGATWVDDHIQIPGTNSAFMYGVSDEEFNIAARGNIVAVVIGGFTNDVVLLKSLDGGVTWTRTVILPFPLGSLYNPTTMNTDTNSDGIGDTISSNAGDVTVAIDALNICHVSFSHMFVSENPGETAVSYDPYDNTGLYYWHEGMTAPSIVAAAEDLNGNGYLDIPIPSLTTTPFGLYNVGLIGQPSIGLDPLNYIYIAYSAIDERGDTSSYQQALRHVFLITSFDNGTTWCVPYCVVPDPAGGGAFQEAVWPSIATLIDNYVHIVYQRDPAPGTSLSNDPVVAANNANPSDIVYAQASTLIWWSFCRLGVKENTTKKLEADIYPNPNSGRFEIDLGKVQKDIEVKICNVFGQVISLKHCTSAIHLTENIKGANGFYFVHLSSEQGNATLRVLKQ